MLFDVKTLLWTRVVTSDRSTIHDLVLGDCVVFMVDTWPSACCLPFDYVNLHVFNLNPHQEEIYFSNYYIFQMVSVKQLKKNKEIIKIKYKEV